MDNKTFCNVFPAFKGGAELDALFSDTQVESIKTYETKKQMIVTLQSDHLIPYHMITRMEALLTQHAYHMGGAGKKIQIFMRYQLSEQYDVRQIAENYKESLLEELRSISRIAFRLMSRAEWYYNEDVISIAVEHSSVAKEHEKLIRDFLVSYFRDHFGKEIEVGFSYSLEQKTKLRQANALRLQQELRTIEEKNGCKDRCTEVPTASRIQCKTSGCSSQILWRRCQIRSQILRERRLWKLSQAAVTGPGCVLWQKL